MRALSWSAWIVSCLAGCAGPKFNGSVYDDGQLHFRTGPVPASWRNIEADGTLFAFRDDAGQATVAVNGRCGVDGDDVPLTSLTQHLFLQFTDRDLVSQEELTLDGRAALRTELRGKLDGVAEHFLVYVIKKDGCVYDFWRISETSGEAKSFEHFVHGFAASQG